MTHAGNRRFAAGTRDGKTRAAGIEENRIQFRAGKAQAPEFVRAADFGNTIFDGGAGDEDLFGRNHSAPVLRVQGEALIFQRGEFFRRAALIVAAIGSFDRAAAPFEDLRKRQHSRAADAAEEEGAGKQFVWSGHIAHAGAAIELCRPTQAR